MGMKPVYFSVQDGRLLFGSEIRPVRTALAAPPAVDVEAMALFLRYRYTPAPRTMFAGIQKLAAGQKLVVENGRITLSRYYQFKPEPFGPPPSDGEATEQLLELYKAAVKRHLMSDVPLGLLLSGGIDSGLLLGLMSLYGKDWPTFTVGYGASFRDDELDDAAATAQIYGAQHHAVRVDQPTFEAALPRIVDILEEPVASSSIVPMYFVCQKAREVVKVALIGQGPDELFGGYRRHRGVYFGGAWRALPRWMRSGARAVLGRLPRNESLRRGFHSLDEEDQLRRFQQVFSLVPGATLGGLFRPDILPDAGSGEAMGCWTDLRPAMEGLDELNAFQMLEMRSSLPDELLMYGDKLSMAHSLEVRVPYLDREVVEFGQRLGGSFKVRLLTQKWLHRRVAREFLPPSILRRKKRGFAVNVVDQWFRKSIEGRMGSYLADSQSLLYAYLNHKAVNHLIVRHANGAEDNHKVLFSLVVLEEWLRGRSRSTQ
jgi:asparagine synthase (glutamine-hydrolysing)